MKILVLETSTKAFSIAVCENEKVLKCRSTELKRVLSDSIIPAVESILKEVKTTLCDLDGFAIGLGPGSFTSLRVGLATVKGLAYASGKPIVGVSSLDVLALNVGRTVAARICVLSDAKRNLVYAAIYENNNGALTRKGSYHLIPVGDLLSLVDRDTVFIGDGLELYREQIMKAGGTKWKASFAPESKWHPRADKLGALAYRRFKNKNFDDIDRLVPLYLYPENCQVQK